VTIRECFQVSISTPVGVEILVDVQVIFSLKGRYLGDAQARLVVPGKLQKEGQITELRECVKESSAQRPKKSL
jgi:hypothetical protein